MRSGHLGSLAEPAVVVSSIADSLQDNRGVPVAGPDLGRRSCDGILGSSMQDFFGGGGGISSGRYS